MKQYITTNRLIDEMIENGISCNDYILSNLEFEHSGRKFVEVILDNGYKCLFYQSLGLGTGVESKGEWVPTPAIDSFGWILKRLHTNDKGEELNPKFTKYDVPLFQRIAKELKDEFTTTEG